MKKSIILSSALIAGLGVASLSTFAATNTGTSSTHTRQTISQSGSMMEHRGWPRGEMGGFGGSMMAPMTDAEKTAFEAMSDSEKKAFLDQKRTEMEAKRTVHEAVIDKLLAGTALTADEEKVRAEIITQRAQMKTQRTEMEAKRTQMEAIMTKKQAGTTLTTDEQKLLDSMPHRGEGMGRDSHRGGWSASGSTATSVQ